MTDQSKDQEPCNMDHPAMTLAEKVTPIQERAEQMGFVSDGSDDKAFMDKAWGEDGQDTKQRDLEVLRGCDQGRAG